MPKKNVRREPGRMKFTQAAVERVKPPASGRVEIWDTQLPGFGLRISCTGRLTWQCLYRVHGTRVRETLGTMAQIPKVDKARSLARESLNKASAGLHPAKARKHAAEEERRQIDAEAARQRDTLAAILDRYVAEYGRQRWRPEYLDEVKRSFDVDLRPLRARPIVEITRRDLRELLDGIVARGRAPHAAHVLAYVRPAFRWAVGKEIVATNPAEGIADPDPRKREARSRKRYLNAEEIPRFWSGCNKIGLPFGPLFQLLLLTGQRRDEVAEARWTEFDLDKALWTLPGERTKNGNAHLVHLSPLAVEILGALPVIDSKGYLFTTTGRSPVSGFGRARERLAAAMAEEGGAIEQFTLHDLRRTAATSMAEIGVAQHVVEKILNHTGGKISGVAATYNRFEYLPERKAAILAWSRRVEGLARGVPSNVVAIR